jgi:hypothetical protein
LKAEQPYAGARAVLATQHGKARAIAPAFARRTGMAVVESAIDTDRFGSFTGEVARTGTALDAAIAKARAGMAATGSALGLASEGSFGPHPWLPFGAAGVETLVFIDAARGLVISETRLSRRTNYARLKIGPGADVPAFLARAGFPAHALVVRGADSAVLAKGVQDDAVLARLLPHAAALETDMRAHMNPTRMAAIRSVAVRLAARLATPCPACGSPGFGSIAPRPGLPCSDCRQPTAMAAGLTVTCPACGHVENRSRPDGRTAASPADCGWCNP